MDNKFIFKEVTQTTQTLYIRRDPMVQQEPSYWLMNHVPVVIAMDFKTHKKMFTI